jgi:hypothetical protein
VRVTAPDGRRWEVYAFRFRLDRATDAVGDRRRRLRVLAGVLRDLPRAALASLRSDEWTVEAVTWAPHRTAYTWLTTGEYRGHVLAQVEGQLARGEVPTPRHATYLGASG